MKPKNLFIKKMQSQTVKKNILVGLCFAFSLINAAYCYMLSHSKFSLGFAAIILAFDIMLYVVIDQLYNKGVLSINIAFAIVLSFLGLLFCAVFTPGIIPDEMYHYLASYRYSNAFLFLAPDTQGITMRAEDTKLIQAFFSHKLENQAYVDVINSSFFATDNSLIFSDLNQGTSFEANLPQLKIFSAIGLTLGRMIGLGAYSAFYLGRLFNLASFIVMVYFAVRILPFGKNIMRIVSLLPMTLHLAASYSYDAAIIGLSFLLLALCINAISSKRAIERRTCIAIGILVFLLAPCKLVYLVIPFLVFLIPNIRFSSRRSALLFKFGVIALGIVSILIIKASALSSIASIETADTVSVIGDKEGYLYTLGDIFANPFKFIAILIRTTFIDGGFYLITLVGGSLGWFQSEIGAPLYFILAFFALLFVSALPTPEDKEVAPLSSRIVFLLITGLGYFAILLSMYVSWTFNTSPVIEGVQGRYFLPLLPLALLAIRGKTFQATRNLSWALMFAMLMLNSMYMMYVFSVALTL